MAKAKTVDGPDSPSSVGWTEAVSIRLATAEAPFALELGGSIGPVDVEYELYGKLNAAKDNVVLICHALSGDAHVAGWDKNAAATGRTYREKNPGWWDTMVGPGKPIDTDRYCVLCANVLGSCYGTTGPSSTNPATGKPYGLGFPLVTVSDWVKLQALLLDRSAWSASTPSSAARSAASRPWNGRWPTPNASSAPWCWRPARGSRPRASAFNAVGRYSILNDPNFRGGDYYDGPPPGTGLAAARMLAHITYLSDEGMHEKFGRKTRRRKQVRAAASACEFEVESYLDHQGRAFVERFDANSYLYITRAMDYYDAAERWGGGNLVEACRRIRSAVLIVSFSSDWLYPPGALPRIRPGAQPQRQAGDLRRSAVALRPRLLPGRDRQGRPAAARLPRRSGATRVMP